MPASKLQLMKFIYFVSVLPGIASAQNAV